jgi:hypothetical protein
VLGCQGEPDVNSKAPSHLKVAVALQRYAAGTTMLDLNSGDEAEPVWPAVRADLVVRWFASTRSLAREATFRKPCHAGSIL